MKKKRLLLCTVLIILFAPAILLRADTYIKVKRHTDSYYYGGVVNPEQNTEREFWLDEDHLSTITRNRITIIDLGKNRAFVVNRNDKTYVESPLPVELSKLVPEEIAPLLESTVYRGSVEKTGKKRKIGTWKCDEYDLSTYLIYQGQQANIAETRLWAVNKVPFSLEAYQKMADTMQRLDNFSAPLIAELKKIKGYPVAFEMLFYPKGFSVKTTEEVVEMTEKEPPAGVYSVPEGFTKKDKLTIQDLRNR